MTSSSPISFLHACPQLPMLTCYMVYVSDFNIFNYHSQRHTKTVVNMKIKELQKTVNVAWSPAEQNPIMLAAGTAAQQLDASSNALLEIYATNLSDPGYDLVLKGSQISPYRYVFNFMMPAERMQLHYPFQTVSTKLSGVRLDSVASMRTVSLPAVVKVATCLCTMPQKC